MFGSASGASVRYADDGDLYLYIEQSIMRMIDLRYYYLKLLEIVIVSKLRYSDVRHAVDLCC